MNFNSKLLGKAIFWGNFKKNKIKALDITIFLRQFATLISAGISIVQSCEILEKSQEKVYLRNLIYAIKRELLTGKNLFTCFKEHRQYFDELTCQLIQIGECTGKLDSMLLTIAAHQEKNLTLKRRIHQALFYPCFILLITAIVTFCMFLFIIPQFAELFKDSQVKLPAITLWIFVVSYWLQHYWMIFVIVILILILLIIFTRLKTILYYFIKRIIFRCPPINHAVKKFILTRFARNLAITFKAGIPITDSLKLAAQSSSNLEFIEIVAKLRSMISTGLHLYHAMLTSPFFPSLMVQMVKIGEESGMLEQMLDKTANFFESDIDNLISRLNQLLEPLIMLILGVVIGVVVIGMYLPIFKLGSAI